LRAENGFHGHTWVSDAQLRLTLHAGFEAGLQSDSDALSRRRRSFVIASEAKQSMEQQAEEWIARRLRSSQRRP
jgi:hypothetical protein